MPCELGFFRNKEYRVFRSRMSFSRWLKMTENRNLHNKTRLLYYQDHPQFHFIAINFIKIYHKCSKSQKSWKMVTKIYQIFFLQNHFLNQNIAFRCHINIFWEEKRKWKILYVIIFFQKIVISNFFKTFTIPRGMNGINGPRGP